MPWDYGRVARREWPTAARASESALVTWPFGHLVSGLCPYCTTTTSSISTVLFQRLQKARSCQPCSAPVTVAFYEPAVTPLLRSVTCVCPLTHCRIRARICLLLRLDRRRLVVLLLRLGRFPPPLPSPLQDRGLQQSHCAC
jgi:hypothetical protein